jgi:tRNA A-37 threonylcarbamoyl transferase component Bud32
MTAAQRICPVCDRAYPGVGVSYCPEDGAPLIVNSGDAPYEGRVIGGRFVIERLIGKGGMGSVFLARQRAIDRLVALKIMQPRGMDPQNAARRFVREARLAASLTHPNIVTVFDFGQEEDGTLFVVMELLNGRGLDALLKEEGTVSVARAARMGAQVCDALAVAHERGIVHRDIKPENVIIVDSSPGRDTCKVVDFGLARSLEESGTRITTSGTIFGTAAYMSPEMALGKDVGPAADLYALGVMLHELVEGRLPFSAETSNGLLLAHATASPAAMSPHVPAAYRNIVAKLLQKKPSDRYASAADVREALLAVGQAPGADKVHRPTVPYRPGAASQRPGADLGSGVSPRSTGIAEAGYVPPEAPEDDAAGVAPQATGSRAGLWWLAAFALLGAGGGALQQAGVFDPYPQITTVVTAGAALAPPRTPSATQAAGAASAVEARPGATAGAPDISAPPPDVAAGPETSGGRSDVDSVDVGPEPSPVVAADAGPSAIGAAVVGPSAGRPVQPALVDFTIRTSAPPSASVSIDGGPPEPTPFRFKGPSRATPRRIELTAPGYQPLTLEVAGDEDSDQTVSLVPAARPAAALRPQAGWRPTTRNIPPPPVRVVKPPTKALPKPSDDAGFIMP